VGEDVLSYKLGSSEYVLYSFNDATDGDVGRYTVGGAYDDDYLSTVGAQTNGTVLTKGVPHQMSLTPDGLAVIITNGRYLAKLTLSSNAIDYQALNLGAGFVATDVDIYQNYIVVIGYKETTYITGYSKSESRVWFWDTTSPFYQNTFNLRDNYATALYVNNGLFAFTQGSSSTTKIKYFNGSNFETIFESRQIGNAPRPGSIETVEGLMHYAPKTSSNLMCLDGKAFHYRTRVTTDGSTNASDIGMVKNLEEGGFLYIGRKVDTAYSLVTLNASQYFTDSATMIYPMVSLPYQSTITKIIVYFSQFGAGASLIASLFKNYSTISVGGAADLTNQTIDYSTMGAISSWSFPVTNGFNVDCFTLHIKFNHASPSNSAAIIRKIEVYYETPERK
jgi:hypothetical protein